jgi:hypothetical protein
MIRVVLDVLTCCLGQDIKSPQLLSWPYLCRCKAETAALLEDFQSCEVSPNAQRARLPARHVSSLTERFTLVPEVWFSLSRNSMSPTFTL